MELRSDLPQLPDRIARLPVDPVRGYPVPWFVAWVDGTPEFRCADGAKLLVAKMYGMCWVCGEPLGNKRTFVIGPMCSVNRLSAEPPSHQSCAEFSVTACPFLLGREMERRYDNLPEGVQKPAGCMVLRNPGVMLLWDTRASAYVVEEHPDGPLWRLRGDPDRTQWWKAGRIATRAEVEQSIEAGLPAVREMAQHDRDALALRNAVAIARRWLPAPHA